MVKKLGFILVLIVLLVSLWLPIKPFNSNQDQDNMNSSISISEGLVIAGIYRNGSTSESIEEGISAREELERFGIDEFIFIDGKRNATDYLKGVKSMIDEEVDGIILGQPFEDQLEEIYDLLKSADIPYVITNSAISHTQYNDNSPTIGVDDYAAGHMTGDWMANYTIKNGLIDNEVVGLIFISDRRLPNMQLRTQGQRNRFYEMIPYFDENNVFEIDFDGTIEDGLKMTTGVIVNTLDVSYWLILASSDEGAIGAVRSLEQLGMDSKAVVATIGGSLGANEFKKEYSALKGSGYYSSAKIGSEAAKVLSAAIHQENPEKETYFNTIIITHDNYLEYVTD